MLLPVFALLAASALTAQSAPQPDAATARTRGAAVVVTGSASAGCPVAFTARRSPDGGLVQTRHSAPGRALGFTVTLGADPQNSHAIEQARITLHGLSGAQLIPADGATTHGPTSEEFSISPSATGEHAVHSVIYAHKLTGVQSVELNELIFADGTQWHESAENPCRISPNGFTHVALTR